MMQNKVQWVRLGDYVHECDERNIHGYDFPMIGINKDKEFMPTAAITTDLDKCKYKIIRKGQFVFSGMQTGRDICIRLGLFQGDTPSLISPAYTTFYINEDLGLLSTYVFLYFNRKEMDRFGWFVSDSSVRANLDWERFLDIRIPKPSIDVQIKVTSVWSGLKEIKSDNQSLIKPIRQVCHSFLQKIKQNYPLQELGLFIRESNIRNVDSIYDDSYVRGLATSKGMISTKANLEGVSLSSYKIVEPYQIAFVPDTSRRGEKISLGINEESHCVLVSSISSVIDVFAKDRLHPLFLYIWFTREEFDRYARFNSWGSAREAFSFEEMKRVKIPLPPMDIQQALVDLYLCANKASLIAEQAEQDAKKICPCLVQYATK